MDLSLREHVGIWIKDSLRNADRRKCLALFQLFGVREIQFQW